MARLNWDDPGLKFYETGLDRGVLYTRSGPGVPWNGLTGVSQKPTGGATSSYYYDGIKYLTETTSSEFEASISAFTYPDEFLPCEGIWTDDDGVEYDSQLPELFHLSYRTLVGNDIDQQNHAYKIHIVYNALASPSSKGFDTLSGSTDASTFTWSFTTTPILSPTRKPTSHVVLDTRKISMEKINRVEDVLYGTASGPASVPTPRLISSIFSGSEYQIYADPKTGMYDIYLDDPGDIVGATSMGVYYPTTTSRLITDESSGTYSLE